MAEEAYGVTSTDERTDAELKAEEATAKKGPISIEEIDALAFTTWGANPSDELIDSADTAVLKAWLDDEKVEYPARTPRARLIDIAKKHAAEPPF